jgi:mono/diheme cytochrome c family protein
MSKEVSYIWRGFFFLLVALAGMGIVQLLIPSKKSSVGAVSAGLPTAPGNTISSPSYNSRRQLLFQANCAVCHPIDRNVEHMDILDIAHVEDRVKDKPLLRGWIRNSDSVLKTGNPYFNALYERWNKAAKPAFPQLSDQDIDGILEYIWRHRK